MTEVNLGVVQIGDRWTIVGAALRTRMFESRHQAEGAARRMADHVVGREVLLHIQDDGFELKPAEAVG